MELRVGVIRDDKYLLHRPGDGFPDRPERLAAVYEMLDRDFREGLITIKPEPVALEDLELVHTPEYVTKVLRSSERSLTPLSPGTVLAEGSYLAAWLAAGGCVKALQAMVAGRCEVCFALVRPPGHRAGRDAAAGACVFNNLGITARYAVERYGMERVLILDWDGDHGDGTQEMFYENKEVLYFSTHYDRRESNSGSWDHTGAGEGLGYTVNIPLPSHLPDDDFVSIYWKCMGPLIRNFQPELILVAAGFSAHIGEKTEEGALTEASFSILTEQLVELRDPLRSPPLLFALEGGYDAGILPRCVKAVLDTLVAKGRRKPRRFSLSPTGVALAEKARSIHAKYRVWTL
ncbi:MAG: histone deacetylase [Pseudomonadota bacterium]